MEGRKRVHVAGYRDQIVTFLSFCNTLGDGLTGNAAIHGVILLDAWTFDCFQLFFCYSTNVGDYF